MEVKPGRQYPNPPIVEVACEFIFASDQSWDLTYTGLIYERLCSIFPERKSLNQVMHGMFVGHSDFEQWVNFGDIARFSRPDQLAFVLLGSNRLSIHHVRPYPTWAEYKPLIETAFAAYIEVVHPTGLRRMGLRYINHISIPSGDEPPRYFNLRPHIGSGLPTALTGFVAAIEAAFTQERDRLRIQVNTVESATPQAITVAVDIDYFLVTPLGIALDDAIPWVDEAHAQVELAFEAIITDDTRELFG